MKKKLIIIAGPTASGKTGVSIELAKNLNSEIISADSMQVYKGMDIGTAKISKEQMQGIRHHLLDILAPDEEFNIVRFKEYTDIALEGIYAQDKIPIVVGGTGFYIHALAYDNIFAENEQEEGKKQGLRRELEEEYDRMGAAFMQEKLRKVDAKSAEAIHPNNKKRVVRALEYFFQTGERISDHNAREREKDSPYALYYYVLMPSREKLYRQIDQRVDAMLAGGLVEEVRGLLLSGYDRKLVSMQGLGYKEIIAYLQGEISLEEAIYILKRDTRHFAKRQITWFKRERDVRMIDTEKFSGAAAIADFIVEEVLS